jgi:ATP-dependent DNA ligase
MPTFIPPMNATLVTAAFDDPNWLFEVKWDGFRVEAVVDAGATRIWTRVLRAVGRPRGEQAVVVVLEGAAATHRDEPGIPDLGEDHCSAHSRLHRRSPEPFNSLLGWG